MWLVDNQTPYKVERAWGRDRDGIHQWIVAVKATFDIKPDGTLALAQDQVDALLAPEYTGEPGRSSLRYDADVVATKPTTDVIVNGTAYAPGGRPSADFIISLRVGPLLKVLRVRGHRRWDQALLPGTRPQPQPVLRVSLGYERAYGGYDDAAPDASEHRMDARNPVGVGVVVHEQRRSTQALPNFEYPGQDIEKAGPAGFGAIDSHWSPRLEWQGRYDEAWQENRFPLPPTDWDPRSLQCAPVDQWPPQPLRGGERIEVENLTPAGTLAFVLPRVLLRFRTRLDGRTEEHAGQLGSVIIEPDQSRVMLVWQSTLLVHANGDYLDETIVSEKAFLW